MFISGGQFVWAQAYNNKTIQQIKDRKSFMDLSQRVATSALHDSAQRVDPPRCHRNTREVVLRQIFDWMVVSSNDRETWLMWLKGAAGAGKSAIAHSTAERCVEAKRVVISFFFSGTDPTRRTMAALAATLAYQLILAIPETAENVLRAIERNPLIFEQSIESQIKQLFFDPVVSVQHLFLKHMLLVILDGLDECQNVALQCSLIKLLGKYLSARNLPVQFLIASRPDPRIDSMFRLEEIADILITVPLDRVMHVSDDIRRFLEDRFAEIKNNHPIKLHLPNDWPATSSIEKIIVKSSGQFIYASLAMNYIASPHDHPVHQLQTLEGIRPIQPSSKHPLDDLDALYQNIFSRINNLKLERVLNILAFFLLAGEDRVSIIDWIFQFEPGELETALVDLTAVLTIDSQSEVAPARMQLLHASLSDFLLDGSRSEAYHISSDIYSTKLACLAFALPSMHFFSISDICGSVIRVLIRLLEGAAPSTELYDILLRFAPELEAMDLIFKDALLLLFDILVAMKNLNFIRPENRDVYHHFLLLSQKYLNRLAAATRQIIVQTMEEKTRFDSDDNLEDLRNRLPGIDLVLVQHSNGLPPSNTYSHGPHFHDENNGITRPYFQYSQCNGKKKALFVGINYNGQSWTLRGSINSIRIIRSFIISHYGYKQEDIVTLTDDATDPHARPTRSNMLQAMKELVHDAQPHDSLFFHYTGHGGQIKGTSRGSYDGVIFPVDFESAGVIVNNLIYETMVKPLPAGCRLTAIFDSCHSGTIMDLPYIYSTRGKIKEPNLDAAAARRGLTYARGDMRNTIAMSFANIRTSAMRKAEEIMKATRTSPADVVSLCSCKDSQLSAELNEAGQFFGVMSHAFITALGTNKHQSYEELLVAIRNILKSQNYSQMPQLSSSHPMNHQVMFIC